MESIIRNVRDIESGERRVLEHVLGQQLQENQQLIISIMELEAEPVAAPHPAQTLDDWTHVYDGLADDEIEEIDQIAKTRANLARNLP